MKFPILTVLLLIGEIVSLTLRTPSPSTVSLFQILSLIILALLFIDSDGPSTVPSIMIAFNSAVIIIIALVLIIILVGRITFSTW